MITKVYFIHKNEVFFDDTSINHYLNNIYYPDIFYIGRIKYELDYNFVLLNNQIFLGTERFPNVLFYELQAFILSSLRSKGIHLFFVSIIRIISRYFSKNSYRCLIVPLNTFFNKNVYINKVNKGTLIPTILSFSWKSIYNFLKFYLSESSYRRRSKETDIQLFIKINGEGISYIYTCFGFFDHLIDQISLHANLNIGLIVKGDIHIDEHHSIEDVAISIGMVLSKTLKDKRGIARYGFLLPMDDTLVQVAIDLGGRSNFVWKVSFEREKIGDVPTEMFSHFFKSFSDVAYCNLYIKAEGNNEHHKIEAIFKAFACALKMAISRNHHTNRLPSTKELL